MNHLAKLGLVLGMLACDKEVIPPAQDAHVLAQNPATGEAEPPPLTDCDLAIMELRDAVDVVKILDDNTHIDNNEGPFIDFLNQTTACSPLINVAVEVEQATFDLCSEDDFEEERIEDVFLRLIAQQNITMIEDLCREE